ncbi:hypothetical protein AB6A40_011336 [Gnathostoma spinigerum]|uniref:Uncharacterized protein n=1 Tax=Gnathostoma spinigerum TaxID=75299 RepID=A0ABD6EZN6_9BILA
MIFEIPLEQFPLPMSTTKQRPTLRLDTPSHSSAHTDRESPRIPLRSSPSYGHTNEMYRGIPSLSTSVRRQSQSPFSYHQFSLLPKSPTESEHDRSAGFYRHVEVTFRQPLVQSCIPSASHVWRSFTQSVPSCFASVTTTICSGLFRYSLKVLKYRESRVQQGCYL